MTPKFFDPTGAKAGLMYRPDTAGAYEDGIRAGLSPASQTTDPICFVIVDQEADFALGADPNYDPNDPVKKLLWPGGSLFVPGSHEDSARMVNKFGLNNIDRIGRLVASIDVHPLKAIHLRSWWRNSHNEMPPPFQLVTTDCVDSGKWVPLFKKKWSLQYPYRLKEVGAPDLVVWPDHCIVGTAGAQLVPYVAEFIAFWSGAKFDQPIHWVKGMIPETEYYGIFGPEVDVPNHPEGGLNTRMLKMLTSYHRIYIAGEAKSHCVIATLRQIVKFFENEPDVLKKIRFLGDCTSSVQHPEVDFDQIANAQLMDYVHKHGIKIVSSEDPIT